MPERTFDEIPANVLAAYDLLLEELQREIERVRQSVGAAESTGDYAEASEGLSRARRLEQIRRAFAANGDLLRQTVATPTRQHAPSVTETYLREAPQPRRLRQGEGTTLNAYRVPILRALVDVGGSAPASDVLAAVLDAMRGVLTESDYQVLADGRTERWYKTAEWCKYTMRVEGLIAADSPRGLWEITEAGRRWLKAQDR